MLAIFLLLALCRLSFAIIIDQQQSDFVDLLGNDQLSENLSADYSLMKLLEERVGETEQSDSENVGGDELQDFGLPLEESLNNDRLTELFVSEFFSDSGLDLIVDRALDAANKKLKEKEQHKRRIPDIKPKFVKELFNTELSAEFSAEDGLAFDMSTLQRINPSHLINFQLDGTLNVNVSVGLKVATIAYNSSRLTMQGMSVNSGKLTASIKENSVTAEIELNLRKCETKLKILTINKLSDLHLYLSELSKFTNWVANNVANGLLNASQDSVKKFLHPYLFQAAQETLKDIDICKLWRN